MSWWGKLVGGTFGFMVGGPLGALIGAAIGHNFDSGLKLQASGSPGDQERVQTAFFTATFSVMGHIAKADGYVSKDEIANARQVMASMGLDAEMQKVAINLFQQGKARDFPLDTILEQFRQECRRRQNLIRLFIEIQLQAAYADGVMHPKERAVLLHICRRLGISPDEFDVLAGAAGAERSYGGVAGRNRMSLDDAYAILEINRSSNDREIKKAYRRMMSRHHPDKLVARGLPEEMMKIATEKTQEIQAAYEVIKKSR
ncbi:DnaJ-like protein DjlA [bacterium BMS3Bbin11]|nr:DnaJ-like protein DjlA [bacterium BMS3Abin11]GBE46381.1 DnaJ-like protein DjlA [bacterium BMS3Bbin11]GMT39575.1 MAG: co-chaperone protein DjlA [bacterium]HDH15549.1 co-chaperone DjlA [Gammaproteobacteria bacterium]HDZ78007.1 co-chaperone DjlA [Gammaproteobacteria bacterium]